MLPSTAKDILESAEPKVIISTFATLTNLQHKHNDIYESLAKSISLVIVDEGHYEPAVKWGKAVKGLKTKTVILTATPYRNDLKLFRIKDSKQSTHHFTHQKAVEKGIIRNVRFEDLDSTTDIRSLSSAFLKKWRELQQNNELPSPDPRAIICCSGDNDIETTVSYLNNAGVKAIGVHDQFVSYKNSSLMKIVPDPLETNAEIWVHQHKLTEGLDDHRFCCVALFTRINNDRKLIQQIGRVLRKNNQDQKKSAVLLAPTDFSVNTEWNAYLEFETQLNLLEPQHFREVVENLLDLQPEVEYFEGRFRRRFNPKDLIQNPQVIISPSVLVRLSTSNFSLDDYIEDCTDTLNTEDAVILGPDINSPCHKSPTFALWVYASIRNSRALQRTSLYEIRLETHCVVITKGFVFMCDSRGIYPIDYLDNHTRLVPPDTLSRYIDKTFRPVHVSLSNSIPYDSVPRSMELRGHNILNVPTSIIDRVQILRTIRGTSKVSDRRYIGIINSRVKNEVSEEIRRNFDLKTFVNWAETVAKVLDSNIESSQLFHRYMPTCAPPEIVVPKTISIDFLNKDLRLTILDNKECDLKRSSSDFQVSERKGQKIYTCTFDLEVAGNENLSFSLQAEYNPTKQRFWFKKDGRVSILVNFEDDKGSSSKRLSEFLNLNQEIILISLEDGETVYQGRSFYKIDYEYAEKFLLDLIIQPQKSVPCWSEKGRSTEIDSLRQSNSTVFPDGSLFRAVTDQLVDHPFESDLLICDDMGTESADFIAANFEKHQLALIHAKAGNGKKISATAFHDVVAQAMKNLVYLTGNQEVPKSVSSWKRNSKWNKTNVPKLYRIPENFPTSMSLWNKIRSEIINTSNPDLYVVLMTTGCCDREILEQAVRDSRRRTSETAQLLHLLDGLNAYARQLGVKLVIYDLPYQPNNQ